MDLLTAAAPQVAAAAAAQEVEGATRAAADLLDLAADLRRLDRAGGEASTPPPPVETEGIADGVTQMEVSPVVAPVANGGDGVPPDLISHQSTV